MTNEELYLWRKGLRWSRKLAAAKLGISVASLQIYERGTRFDSDEPVHVPQVVALACKHLSAVEAEAFKACCSKESRNINGGCDNCGAPCL